MPFLPVRFTLTAAAAVLALVSAGAADAAAQETASAPARPYRVVSAENLSWTVDPEFYELDHAVVMGNLRAAEPYVYRLRANAPAELPLHTHGRTEYVTVLRGTLHHAPEGADRSAARPCGEGCFIVIPAGRGHQAWLEPGTVLQIHGTGPVEAHGHPGSS